jgi:hypothetical protein
MNEAIAIGQEPVPQMPLILGAVTG